MSRKPREPRYPTKPHASGQARIQLAGEEIYLGVWGSPESHAEFARRVAEWKANGYRPVSRRQVRTVDGVLGEFWQWVEREGRYSDWERKNYQRSLVPVHELYGDRPVADFDALALKAVRRKMVEDGARSRKMINARVGRIRRVWKWAASEKLIPLACWQELETVAGLAPGEGGTVDYDDVPPADPRDVDATLDELTPVVAAMVRLQLLTGARPGEVIGLRPCDITRAGTVEIERGVSINAGRVWVTVLRPRRVARPKQEDAGARPSHKTGYRGHTRVILYGPRAQELLAPFLKRPADAWLFNPTEARAAHHTERAKRANGHSRAKGVRVRNSRYTIGSYGRAILRAADRANRKAMEREGTTARQVAHWHPHQLRHAAATVIADEFGPELARIVLGQRTLSATRVYLRDSLDRAADVIEKTG